MPQPQDDFAIGQTNFRILETYFKNKIPVHFKFNSSHPKRAGAFQNGDIIDLNEKKRTLVLKERIDDMQPILLEYIETDSITPYKDPYKDFDIADKYEEEI